MDKAKMTEGKSTTKQTPKMKEKKPQGEMIDETVREYQTHRHLPREQAEGWEAGAYKDYAPTSHTSNMIEKRVLDVMPTTEGCAPDTPAVMGAGVKMLSVDVMQPIEKAEWDYKQAERMGADTPAGPKMPKDLSPPTSSE